MAKYIDIKNIGSGGFGEVWQCERDADKHIFAKKKLKPGTDDEGIRRFIREVRILSSLYHPNIVKVIGKRLSNDPYFYIMPLYSTSLKKELPSLIGNDTRIKPIFSAIIDGIEYAHSEGVIHRDLKPENVLLNSDTDVVVTDFGLSRILDSESTRHTVTGYGMGTLFYMAPEQFSNAKDADARSEIYSIGRMLYELFSGPITSFAQDTSTLPPGVAFLVNKCTENDPNKRFQTVSDLKHAWLTLFDSSYLKSEIDELMNIRAKLSPPAIFSQEEVIKFLDLIMKYHEDKDLLHETIMQIDPSVFGAMCNHDINKIKHIISDFVEFATSQSWGFSYTDKIADQCKKLFNIVHDYDIRSILIYCLMVVGVNHNRWHVMGIFSELIEGPKDAGEAIAIEARIMQSDESTRKWALNYINLGKLHPKIRHLFDFE
jgi:serine/threonine protein kinase